MRKLSLFLFIIALLGVFVSALSIYFNWSLLMKSLPHVLFFSGFLIATFAVLSIRKNNLPISILVISFALIGSVLWGLSIYGIIDLKTYWTYAVATLVTATIFSLYSFLIIPEHKILSYFRGIFLITLLIPLAFLVKWDNSLYYEIAEIILIIFSVFLVFASFIKRSESEESLKTRDK